MVTRCAKCGQTVLQTDAACWQCGTQQAGKKGELHPPEKRQEMGYTAVLQESPISLTAVSTYALFTLICLLALLLILRSLATQPLFLSNPLLDRDPDWQPIADSNLQFTLDIPPTWYALENEGNVPTIAFQQALAQANADTAFQALEANFAGDIVPYMLIQDDQSSAYLLIVGSKGLQSASNAQLTELVARSGWDVLRFNEGDLDMADNRLAITHYLGVAEREIRCTTQFIPAENDRFILIGCAPAEQFPRVAEKINNMLALFQPLVYQN